MLQKTTEHALESVAATCIRRVTSACFMQLRCCTSALRAAAVTSECTLLEVQSLHNSNTMHSVLRIHHTAVPNNNKHNGMRLTYVSRAGIDHSDL